MTGTTDTAPAVAPSPTAVAVSGMTPDATPVGTPSPAAIGGKQVEDKAASYEDTINTNILSQIDAMYEDAAIDMFRDDEHEAVEFTEEVSDEAPEVNLICTSFFLCFVVLCIC